MVHLDISVTSPLLFLSPAADLTPDTVKLCRRVRSPIRALGPHISAARYASLKIQRINQTLGGYDRANDSAVASSFQHCAGSTN